MSTEHKLIFTRELQRCKMVVTCTPANYNIDIKIPDKKGQVNNKSNIIIIMITPQSLRPSKTC